MPVLTYLHVMEYKLMLKYLIAGTENLIVTGVLVGMLFAYIFVKYAEQGRNYVTVGAVAGLGAAAVMAYMKNKTKLIDTGKWNIRIFSVSLAILVIFLILDTMWFHKKTKGRDRIVIPLLAAVLVFLQIFYAFPDTMAYPYNFVLGGSAVLSTDFLYRLIGLVIGIALVAVMAIAVHFICIRLDAKAGADALELVAEAAAEGPKARIAGIVLKIALLINAMQQVTKILQTLYTRRIIRAKWVFKLVKFTSNHSDMFIFGILLVTFIVPLVLWIASFRANEPYENPAQHRKIRASWRSIRRWSTAAIICSLLVVLNLTAVKAYANRPAELSPTEECEQRGDNLYIPFTQVEDGHLHRFAYTTDNNVAVRFIIIKKPNSSSYGVGLDACDICGETGYYERSGQVVCNRCDVVMNINTIGFKGGCNPKVIDYSIENGYIIVPTYTLIEHEKDFK